MLVFPHWKSEIPGGGCRARPWLPAERFAPYFASTIALPPLPPQVEDEESSGGSSPERDNSSEREVTACGWRGCGARFPGVARLSVHVARTHAIAHADGLFYCGWKGCTRPLRGFNARYKMLVHVRTHTNERPHTCNQCQKSFSRAENLKIHLRSHSGEKPYVCPYEGCGKAYSNSSDRFKHTRTHTVDKPYCCKVPGCNKRYTDPSSLRKHVKTYKHFTTEEAARRDAYEDTRRSYSPHIEAPRFTSLEPLSPLQHRLTYTPPNKSASPVTTYSSLVPLTESSMSPVRYIQLDHNSYVRPFEQIYSTRVPAQEMSYVEYTHMYEHAYRSYYANHISDPILRPTVTEKVFTYDNTYETPRISDVTMDEDQITSFMKDAPVSYSPVEEKPLNLICSKRLECKPIEELVRRSDLPLDLSTKT